MADDYLYRVLGEKERLNELKTIINNILKEI